MCDLGSFAWIAGKQAQSASIKARSNHETARYFTQQDIEFIEGNIGVQELKKD